MESTTDLLLFIAIALTSIVGLYVVGRIDEDKREMKRRRKQAQHGANNYARIRAQLVLSSGTVKKGRRY